MISPWVIHKCKNGHNWATRKGLVCMVGLMIEINTLITRFMGPTWGPSGADRTQVGPMLAPWTLLSGYQLDWSTWNIVVCNPVPQKGKLASQPSECSTTFMAHKKCKEMLQPANNHQFHIHIGDIECDRYELKDKFPKHPWWQGSWGQDWAHLGPTGPRWAPCTLLSGIDAYTFMLWIEINTKPLYKQL